MLPEYCLYFKNFGVLYTRYCLYINVSGIEYSVYCLQYFGARHSGILLYFMFFVLDTLECSMYVKYLGILYCSCFEYSQYFGI